MSAEIKNQYNQSSSVQNEFVSHIAKKEISCLVQV